MGLFFFFFGKIFFQYVDDALIVVNFVMSNYQPPLIYIGSVQSRSAMDENNWVGDLNGLASSVLCSGYAAARTFACGNKSIDTFQYRSNANHIPYFLNYNIKYFNPLSIKTSPN